MITTTLILLKSDTVLRGLTGELIQRFEKTGLSFAGMKMVHPSRELASKHYEEHFGKSFYNELIDFLTEAPVVALALRGHDAVQICRKLRGPTNPANALPGTICGDYCHYLYRGRNLVHASSDDEAAKRELALWFSSEELFAYDRYDAPATMGFLETEK